MCECVDELFPQCIVIATTNVRIVFHICTCIYSANILDFVMVYRCSLVILYEHFPLCSRQHPSSYSFSSPEEWGLLTSETSLTSLCRDPFHIFSNFCALDRSCDLTQAVNSYMRVVRSIYLSEPLLYRPTSDILRYCRRNYVDSTMFDISWPRYLNSFTFVTGALFTEIKDLLFLIASSTLNALSQLFHRITTTQVSKTFYRRFLNYAGVLPG